MSNHKKTIIQVQGFAIAILNQNDPVAVRGQSFVVRASVFRSFCETVFRVICLIRGWSIL